MQVTSQLSNPPLTIAQLAKKPSPQRLFFIFVHGNRIPAAQVVERGQLVYEMLLTDSPPGLDFAIWSWPSARIRRPVADVRVKAARTEREACLLSQFLQRVDRRVQVRLIGYSFGARVITSALHRMSEQSKRARRDLRVGLLAAAVHHDWLEPNRQYCGAMSQMESLLLFVNHCDPALKRYGIVARRGRALGFVGFPSDSSLGLQLEKVTTVDVSDIVGRSHSLLPYVGSASISSTIRSHMFVKLPEPVQLKHDKKLARTGAK